MVVIHDEFKTIGFNLTKKINRTIKWIVIHNTGTDASAENNCKYFRSGNRGASADFFVNKNGSIYLYNGDIKNYYSWHSGKKAMNIESIGIEVVNSGEEFTGPQQLALQELIDYLCKTYGIDRNNIIRHYDVTGKICPMAYSGTESKNRKWQALKATISSIPEAKPEAGTKLVKITANALNVRKSATTLSKVVTTVHKGELYTITEEKGGWGKLKSGIGWISLKYTKTI